MTHKTKLGAGRLLTAGLLCRIVYKNSHHVAIQLENGDIYHVQPNEIELI